MIIIMAHGATAARSRTSRRVWNRWAAGYYLRAELSIIGVIGNGRPDRPASDRAHVRCGADRAGLRPFKLASRGVPSTGYRLPNQWCVDWWQSEWS